MRALPPLPSATAHGNKLHSSKKPNGTNQGADVLYNQKHQAISRLAKSTNFVTTLLFQIPLLVCFQAAYRLIQNPVFKSARTCRVVQHCADKLTFRNFHSIKFDTNHIKTATS